MHIAALQAFGPTRTQDYLPLAKWNRGGTRPSLQDIVSLARHLILGEHPAEATIQRYDAHTLVTKAAA